MAAAATDKLVARLIVNRCSNQIALGPIPGGRMLAWGSEGCLGPKTAKYHSMPKATHAHAGSRTRVKRMGRLYDAATHHVLKNCQICVAANVAFVLVKFGALPRVEQLTRKQTE